MQPHKLKRLDQPSPIFVILCLLCFQRQYFFTLLFYSKSKEFVHLRRTLFPFTDKTSKRLTLEAKNIQKNEIRRLVFIKSLLMQQCSLRGCTCPTALAEAV